MGHKARISADKSYGFDLVYFVATELKNEIERDDGVSFKRFKEKAIKTISYVTGITDKVQLNNNFSEPLSSLVSAGIVIFDEEKRDSIKYYNKEYLDYISESLENSMIFMNMRSMNILSIFMPIFYKKIFIDSKPTAEELNSPESNICIKKAFQEFSTNYNNFIESDWKKFSKKKIKVGINANNDSYKKFAYIIKYPLNIFYNIQVSRKLSCKVVSDELQIIKNLALNLPGTKNKDIIKKNSYLNDIDLNYVKDSSRYFLSINFLSISVNKLEKQEIIKNISKLKLKIDNALESKYDFERTITSNTENTFLQSDWSEIIRNFFPEERCMFCGCHNIAKGFLQAAHLLDKHKTESLYEKYSESNGIILCPNCHKLFDAGIIMFDENNFYIDDKIAISKIKNICINDANEIKLFQFEMLNNDHFNFLKRKWINKKCWSKYKIKK